MSSLTELRRETVVPPSADGVGDAPVLPPRPLVLSHASANRRLGLVLVIVAATMLVMTIAAAIAIHLAGNPQFNV